MPNPSGAWKPGQWKIDLSDDRLEKRISKAEALLLLDDAATFEVEIACDPKLQKELAFSSLPEKASLKWQDKSLFSGHLLSTRWSEPARLTLSYRDLLYKTKKHYENMFFKQQSLSECLDKMAQKVGLSCRYVGNFTDPLPALDLSGGSVYDHWQNLSHAYGFYFTCRGPGDQVTFLKAGSSLKTVSLDGKIGAIRELSQSVEALMSQAEVRFFDPSTMETEEKSVSSNTLQANAGTFKEHSAFREKTAWTLAAGKMATAAPDRHHFDALEKQLSSQVAKALMQQESLNGTVYEPLALPGDAIQLQSQASGFHSGAYLVAKSRVSILSALPRMELTLLRA